MKTRKKWIATIMPLALAAAACSAEPLTGDEAIDSVDQAVIVDELEIPGVGNRNYVLGDGFDSMTQSFKATCVENSQTLPRVPGSGAIVFDREMTTSQVDSMFGVKADVKARYGAYNASARAAFNRSTQSRRTSINVVFGATYDLGTVRFKEPGARVVGNTNRWYQRCGDGFVSQISQGADLAILYRIDFASESDKQAFSASIGGNYAGMVSADAEMKRAAAEFRGRASVHVEAHQFGGDLSRMGSILNADNGHVAMKCDIDDLAACNSLVARGIRYAAEDFAASVRSQPGNRSYIIKDWSLLSIAPESVTQSVPSDITAARTTLAELFDNEMEVQDRITSLSRSNFSLSTPHTALLNQFRTKSARNLAVLRAIIPRCFDDLDLTDAASKATCKAAVRKPGAQGLIQAGYVTLDVEDLDFPRTGMIARDADGNIVRRDLVQNITVGNGRWGTWRDWEYCADGEYGIGYQMRVEERQGSGDDSALNAVRIKCARLDHGSANTSIVSYGGLWGDWHPYKFCSNGVLRGGKMKIEAPIDGDDSSANDVKMACSDGDYIQATGGGEWGEWASEYEMCPAGTAVCGIRSRFEKYQGDDGDDTAMNGLNLACCAF